MDIFTYAENLKEKAKQVLLTDGYHCSMLICFSLKEQHFIPLSISTDEQKIKTMAAVKHLMNKLHVWAYIAITEGWMIAGSTDKPVDTTIKPSESPERIRILAVSVVSHKRKKIWTIPIKEKHGKISFGKENVLDTQNKCTAEGLFMDLLQVCH